MIRFICFLLIELSCVLIIKAQDNSISKYISFEKQLFLDYDIHGPVKFNYSKSICSNEIAITFYNTKESVDTIRFYILNMGIDSVYIENYHINNLSQLVTNSYTSSLTNISLSKDFIAIITFDYVYLLERKTKYIINQLDNKKYHFENAAFLDGDRIFMYRNYNNLEKKKKTQFAVFSVPNFKLIKEKYPVFDFIQYTHIAPNKWISSLNNKILFSQTLDYSISLYDNLLNKTNTISLPSSFSWSSPSESQKQQIKNKKRAVESINEILNYENEINRVAGIYWISDTTFIVNINKGIGENKDNIKYKLSFDVWKYRDDKWILDKYNLVDRPIEEIELANDEYSLFAGKLGRNYIFTEEYIYLLTFNVPLTINKYSTDDYIKASNEYLYENNPVFQLIKFKHTLNE